MANKGRFTVALLALGALAVLASAQAGERPGVIVGEVVEVHENAVTSDGRSWDEVTVVDEEMQRIRLRLGPAGSAPGACQVGDTIRVRLMAQEPQEGAYLARNMRNRRTRTMTQYRDAEGELVQTRSQVRQQARDGSCDGTARQEQIRERVHQRTGRSGGGAGGNGGRGGR